MSHDHDHDPARGHAAQRHAVVPAGGDRGGGPDRAGAGATTARLPVQRRAADPGARPGALPFLDAQIAGGAHGAAVQRKEEHGAGGGSMSSMVGGMMGTAGRFALGDHDERARLLAAEPDWRQRARLLDSLAPGPAYDLLVGEDAVTMHPAQRILVAERLPRVLRMLDVRTAKTLIGTNPHVAATRRVFARLELVTQLEVFVRLAPRMRAAVWPDDGGHALRSALLGRLDDRALSSLVKDLTHREVGDLMDYQPPHLVARVRAACIAAGVHPDLAGTAASAQGEAGVEDAAASNGAGAATADVDAVADELTVAGEQWDAASKPPSRVQRFKTSMTPEPGDWRQLPAPMRRHYFRNASTGRRVVYLSREPEDRAALLRSIADPRDRGETLAAFLRRQHRGYALIDDLDDADLVAAVRVMPDPADVGALVLGLLRNPRRLGLIAALAAPHQIAPAVALATTAELPRLWSALTDQVAPATITAILRRLPDDQLERLVQWSNDPDGVTRLAPPGRLPSS
jgi:hypothetical protein